MTAAEGGRQRANLHAGVPEGGSLPFFRNSMQRGHCPFQFGFCSAKRRGHGRLGRVDTGRLFSQPAHRNQGARQHTHRRCLRARRDALCPSAEIQKLKAIGIIRDDLRGTLMTKNEQFLSSNEKTARSFFAYHINQMCLCPASSILSASHFCPRPFCSLIL